MSPIFNVQFKAEDGIGENADGLQHFGPTIPIILSRYRYPGLIESEETSNSESGLALIDTGALVTSVDIELAEKLGLTVVDTRPMTSATGTEVMPVFAARIDIQSGGVGIDAEAAIGARLAPMNIAVLLGRDVLRSGILVYNGPAGIISLAI